VKSIHQPLLTQTVSKEILIDLSVEDFTLCLP
jgi:hypothetical protein